MDDLEKVKLLSLQYLLSVIATMTDEKCLSEEQKQARAKYLKSTYDLITFALKEEQCLIQLKIKRNSKTW